MSDTAKRTKNAWFVFWIAVVFGPSTAFAQDAHYWSLHYGPIGQLLGGTTVGGVNDLSATFYNPGALALIEEPRFLLSFDTFQISSLKVENGAGEGLDLTDTKIRSIPRIIAGDFGLDALGDDRLAYSVITRQQAEFNFQTAGNDIPPLPAENGRSALVRLDQSLTEYWAGGTWARKFNDKLGLGASMYFAVRGQRIRSEVIAQSVTAETSRAFIFTDDYSYNHLRLLWKLGVAYRDGPLQLGATITTPGLGLAGWGSATLNTATIGTNIEASLAGDVQKGLSSDFRSPTSVAGGASYRWNRTRVHVSSEWFNGVGSFKVLDPEPAPIVGTEETIPLTLTRKTESIVNYGIGIEHTFEARDYGLYASLTRDNSAWNPESLDAISVWDLTHLRFGLTLGAGQSQWAVGLGYAWGGGDVTRLEPPGPGAGGTTRAEFGRLNIFVALAFGR